MKKSIAKNALLNVIRNVSNIIYPLVTFPYVSRVLGVDAIGKYNFASSFISYFILIAGLGISSYAIREGARIREDKESLSLFASEMFAINIISTFLAYVCLFICVICIRKLDDYRLLLFVFSFQIIMTTIGVEWIYSIYEDYKYITIRTLFFKLISLILLFLFVRTKDDVVKYAGVTTFALSGSGVLNLIHSRKYLKFDFKKITSIKQHMKPILTLFSASVAVMIYVYSDTTILGFLKSDYEVGLYSLSSKIYTIIKSVISAMLIVSIPRLSALYGNKEFDEYNHTLQKIIDSIGVLLLPCVVGLFILSDNIVQFVGGSDYLEAAPSLRLLSVALLFCLYGWIFNQCILLPSKNEKTISFATIISALINISLNFVLIPMWSENAAAVTTVIAEFLMLLICYCKGRNLNSSKVLNRNLFQIFIGCVGIGIICIFCKLFISNNIILVSVAIIGSVISYGMILLIFKNEQVIKIIVRIKSRRK